MSLLSVELSNRHQKLLERERAFELKNCEIMKDKKQPAQPNISRIVEMKVKQYVEARQASVDKVNLR
jgi:hypothetical protein